MAAAKSGRGAGPPIARREILPGPNTPAGFVMAAQGRARAGRDIGPRRRRGPRGFAGAWGRSAGRYSPTVNATAG